MTFVLFIVVIALGWLVVDARQRLDTVERQLAQRVEADVVNAPNPAEFEPEPWTPESRTHSSLHRAIAPPTPDQPEPTILPTAELPVAPEPADLPEPSRPFGVSFEDIFGRKLPIWAGGLTLLIAAGLMVRYSIDAGLVSPLVRVAMGALFGLALIGAGENARRKPDWMPDPRLAQALAGAGVGALYAATTAASTLYGLLSPAYAFVAMAAITAGAMGLALRFGAPSALLALVGGLATPALVHGQSPNPPLLAGYIALVVSALCVLSRRQRWVWLGISALIGGAGWSALMLASGALSAAGSVSLGGLILLLGLGLPMIVTADQGAAMLRAVAAAGASAQLAVLVAQGDFALLTWGLYVLLCAAFVWMTQRKAALRPVLPVPLLTALGLLALWPHPQEGSFAVVAVGLLAVLGGGCLWRLHRAAMLVDAAMLMVLCLGLDALVSYHFALSATAQTLVALGLALVPAAGAALVWRNEREGLCFTLPAGTVAVLVAIAALAALPQWLPPVALTAVAGGTLFLARKADNAWLGSGAIALLGAAAVTLTFTGEGLAEGAHLFTDEPTVNLLHALLRWASVSVGAAGFAWAYHGGNTGKALQILAMLPFYGLLAQILPVQWLVSALMVVLVCMGEVMARRTDRALFPAMGALAALAGVWAVYPLLQWTAEALPSLVGQPMLVSGLPVPLVVLKLILIPTGLGGWALWRLLDRVGLPRLQAVLPAAGMIGVHCLYKQVFALQSVPDFVTNGLVERTVWEAALVALGAGMCWRGRAPKAGIGLALIGLAHGLWYSVLLHNPLWSHQAVGAWPLINLIGAAYAVMFLAIALNERILGAFWPAAKQAGDGLRMALIPLFVFALLRQLFAGSLPAGQPIGSTESIGWSLAAVVMAVAYLLWGIRQQSRDWRLASLVLMLGAVGKVFLIDASGLQGLMRIGSFLALGFSLMGIGWLYSRFLKQEP